MAARRLLVITEVFPMRDRGLLLAPSIPVGELTDLRFDTELRGELRTPDGGTRPVSAWLTIPRVTPMPVAPLASVLLRGESRGSVPIDSEVWL
jgi:hypothetical protein